MRKKVLFGPQIHVNHPKRQWPHKAPKAEGAKGPRGQNVSSAMLLLLGSTFVAILILPQPLKKVTCFRKKTIFGIDTLNQQLTLSLKHFLALQKLVKLFNSINFYYSKCGVFLLKY